jgi:tRNA (cmo5U34)-methyltransferase
MMGREEKMAEIRSNFSKKSKEYDAHVRNVIPRYEEMLDALISCIDRPCQSKFRAIDLGCGTGAVSERLMIAFPGTELTCLDMTEEMMNVARHRLVLALI